MITDIGGIHELMNATIDMANEDGETQETPLMDELKQMWSNIIAQVMGFFSFFSRGFQQRRRTLSQRPISL